MMESTDGVHIPTISPQLCFWAKLEFRVDVVVDAQANVETTTQRRVPLLCLWDTFWVLFDGEFQCNQ